MRRIICGIMNDFDNIRLGKFTPKMQMLYMDIIASLGQSIDPVVRDYIFGVGPELDLDWVMMVANYITLELIKYSYDEKDTKYPLRHFLNYSVDSDQSERMMHSRIIKYVQKYRGQELKNLGYSPEEISNNDIMKSMNTMEEKLDGYRMTAMNFFEHNNIHDLQVIKAIVERRIVSVKKISNTTFEEIFQEYDDFVEELIKRSEKSDEDLVFSSIAMFTLEWKYPIEFFYLMSKLMEEHGIESIDTDMIAMLCTRVCIESQFGGSVTMDSRMVKERQLFLFTLINKDVDFYDKISLSNLIREIIVMVTQYKEISTTKEGELYKDWFKNQSSIEDWASFFRNYDIFSIWERKEWSKKRIKYMRGLFDTFLLKK